MCVRETTATGSEKSAGQTTVLSLTVRLSCNSIAHNASFPFPLDRNPHHVVPLLQNVSDECLSCMENIVRLRILAGTAHVSLDDSGILR